MGIVKANIGAFERKFKGFHNLMPRRIQEVLMVSSPYDAFIVEEEGNLSEQIFSEYMVLHMRNAPRITRASTGEQALALLQEKNYDLVITMTRLSDMNVASIGKKIKEIRPDCPVVLLAYDKTELTLLPTDPVSVGIDRVFLWTGNTSIILAIIKMIEDSWNVEHDTQAAQVRVIIIIEDSVRYYSMFLPLVYIEMMLQTRRLIDESLNEMHKMQRMRARPKILLAHTYEEGMALYEKYERNVLGVISDVQYERRGMSDPGAGLDFIRRIKDRNPDLPVLLQSADESNRRTAETLGATFLDKTSRSLLYALRNFILRELGFGDFVFRLPDGTELGRASNVVELEDNVAKAPDKSLLYHASRNHFSNWLMARTEFSLALKIAPPKPSDFPDIEHVRDFLIQAFEDARKEMQRGVIAEYSTDKPLPSADFTRIGLGALGGKARGLGFVSLLLTTQEFGKKYPGIKIRVPKTYVLGTNEFDRFVDKNDLRKLSEGKLSDEEVGKKFIEGAFPPDTLKAIKQIVKHADYPLAVRSSSLLEDSHYQPFAGIYSTYIIPNSDPSEEVRLKQLCDAIRLVYASTYESKSLAFLDATQYKVDEEKMAVIVQELAGRPRGEHFYPLISGVAQSYNFYPFSYQKPEEGVAHLALGLGRTIVEGGTALRFSPKHPRVMPQFSSALAFVKKSQRHFYTLKMDGASCNLLKGETSTLSELELEQAEKDGVLGLVAGVYDAANDIIRDSLSYDGPRVISFARMLKYTHWPLADILCDLLELGRYGMGTEVEIEFAVDLGKSPDVEAEFYVLQVRPLALMAQTTDVDIQHTDPDEICCYSGNALGNGIFSTIRDIIYVSPARFDKSKTVAIANEIGALNAKFDGSTHKYVLIGPGRWGSSDQWLGIPVEWKHISHAGVIVEAGIKDLHPDPSYGSHFFQNITSLNIGYITVPFDNKKEFIDWKWLDGMDAVYESEHVRQVHLPDPLEVRIDGRTRQAVLLKSVPVGEQL